MPDATAAERRMMQGRIDALFAGKISEEVFVRNRAARDPAPLSKGLSTSTAPAGPSKGEPAV